MSYCSKCGFELVVEMIYCPRCGARVPSRPLVEEVQVSADQLVQKVKDLLHEGSVRRIIIKNQKGQSIMEVPLTVGVVGVVLAPILAAVGALAALAMSYTVVVERREPQ